MTPTRKPRKKRKQRGDKLIYETYINSSAWASKRKLVLARDDYTCVRCQKRRLRGQHVHHLTYRNLGNEPLGDLVTLCEDCHTREHKRPLATRLKVAKRKAGTCLICKAQFDVKTFPQGGGWYCSPACKASSPRTVARNKKKAARAAAITVKLNPKTLREKGTEAALEERAWLKLGT